MSTKIKHARIFIRVTSQKHQEIQQAAEAIDLSISAYLLALHEGAQESAHIKLQEKRLVTV